MKDKMLLSIAEVSTMLGISRPTVYRLLHSESFPVIRLGGRVLIPAAQLEEWIVVQVKNTKKGNTQ